ncbi:hypothetical protein [Bacillus cereus]|uniref:hypothetical protein n=1 Tax=Bacillus cereus TaxID=1396 RepID=UPI00396F3F64
MSSSISDNVLVELSGQSYRKADKVDVKVGNHREVWIPVEISSSVPLHNPLNYSPLNILTDCLKWEIPKYRVLSNSNGLG